MIRPNRKMPQEDAYRVLREGRYGVLSMSAKDGTPYGVPLNYFYVPEENAIFFHCSTKGRKIDCLKENDRISFVVVGREEIVPERFVTHYDSVIVTGTASFITDGQEKVKRLLQLCRALAPASVGRRDEVIRKELAAVMIVKISIQSVTGKRNRDD